MTCTHFNDRLLLTTAATPHTLLTQRFTRSGVPNATSHIRDWRAGQRVHISRSEHRRCAGRGRDAASAGRHCARHQGLPQWSRQRHGWSPCKAHCRRFGLGGTNFQRAGKYCRVSGRSGEACCTLTDARGSGRVRLLLRDCSCPQTAFPEQSCGYSPAVWAKCCSVTPNALLH